jgi:hypothetical protein
MLLTGSNDPAVSTFFQLTGELEGLRASLVGIVVNIDTCARSGVSTLTLTLAGSPAYLVSWYRARMTMEASIVADTGADRQVS